MSVGNRGGRPAKPTALKKLEGTARPGRTNEDEPEYPALIGQEPPPWLDKIAKEHWVYYAPLLSERGILTAADVTLLAAASERWSVYQRAAVLMKRSVRGRRLSSAERMLLAEQSAILKDPEAANRTRGKLKRGDAPEGNELPADPPIIIDPKYLGEYVVPPQHTIATKALQDYLSIMREFGVGPASRAKVKTEKPEEEDEFEKLMKAGRA